MAGDKRHSGGIFGLWARRLALLAGLLLPLPLAAQVGPAADPPIDWAARLSAAAVAVSQAPTRGAREQALEHLLREQEAAQAALRAEQRALAAEVRAAQAAMGAQSTRLIQLAQLAARQQALAQEGAPLPLLHPQGAAAAARAGMVSAALQIEAGQAQADLAAWLASLEAAQVRAAQAADNLAALAEVTGEARALLIALRPLPKLDPPADAMAQITAALRGAGRVGPGRVPAALPWPVALQAPFRAEGEGLVLPALPGASVRSPAAASVLYAGPLRGQGLVAVLELAPGRRLILARLGALLVAPDDILAPGDLIGFLPDPARSGGAEHTNPTATPFPAGEGGLDRLYIEARDDGRRVDPALWFAIEKDK